MSSDAEISFAVSVDDELSNRTQSITSEAVAVAVAPPPSAHDVISLRGMDPGITVLRDWAPRIAVIVGQALHPSIVAVLASMEFRPVVVSPDRAVSVIKTLGPAC